MCSSDLALARHTQWLVTHDPGARLGREPESLHQMRVATRPRRDDAAFARRIAELDLRLYVLQATCYRAVAELTQDAELAAASSMMKLRGSELRQDIAEAMVDAIGIAGIVVEPSNVETDGIVREHLYSRAATIYGGSNEIQRNIIAKSVLGL